MKAASIYALKTGFNVCSIISVRSRYYKFPLMFFLRYIFKYSP